MSAPLLAFLQTLVDPMKRDVSLGDSVFQPGDSATFLYGIEEGMIRMVRFDGDGGELVVYRAGSGESFAEASLFGEFYHCAVIAETDCRLLVFAKDKILAAMDREPGLLQQYSALLSRQVRDLRSLLEVRSIRAADARLQHYLGLHCDVGGRCCITSSLMGLAGQLGLAHETLYRSLKRLEDNGVIRRQGQDIILL